MISYIIKDLMGALRYLPVGLAIGGIVFLLLFLINKRRIRKNRQPISVAALTCFLIYMAIILCITVWSREASDSSKIDLALWSTWGINNRNNALVVENVLLFIPYGCLLAWVAAGTKGVLWIGFWGLVTSMCVEVLQLATGRGYFQIDDILTNTLGALIGFLCFALVRRILEGKRPK